MTTADIVSGSLSEADHHSQLRRAIIASTIGTTIEWYDFLLHSQLSSHDTTRQIRSLALRKHLLFFDFYHHVGNCQRHGPT